MATNLFIPTSKRALLLSGVTAFVLWLALGLTKGNAPPPPLYVHVLDCEPKHLAPAVVDRYLELKARLLL